MGERGGVFDRDTGTQAGSRRLLLLLSWLWAKWGGERGWGVVLKASAKGPEPTPRVLTTYCPLLAACDGQASRGWLEAVLRGQVPCVQVQVLPLTICAAASKDFISLLQFPSLFE